MAILQNKFVREDGSVIGSSVIISCKYTSEVNSQTNLTVGDTTADEVEVECRILDKEITAGEKLTYYQIEDGVENLIGVFYAEAPTKATKTSIRFKAYDGKAKLAADFSEWLNENQDKFPMSLRSLVGYACEVAGVPLAADSFQFESLSIPAFYTEGVTCRRVISWVAQINGSFVKCNASGEIGFSWYRSTDISVPKSSLIQDSLSKKEYSTDFIKRVQFKQSSDDVGTIYPANADGNVFSISRNGIAALLDSDTLRTIAEYLYEKLKYVTYTPLRFKTIRTAAIKAGDIISVTDGNGETVSTYVMKVYLDSSGIQISSTGDQDYADKAAVSSEQYKDISGKFLNIQKSVDGVSARMGDAEGNIYDLSVKATEQQTLIENAQGDATKALEKAGEVHTKYIKGNGVLSTDIDGTGLWQATYTEDGVEKSSVKFDLDKGLFKFNGELASKDGLTYFSVDDTGGMAVRKYDDLSGPNVAIGKIDFYEFGGKYYPYILMGDGSKQKSLCIQWYDDGIWIGNDFVAQGGVFQAGDGASGYFINTQTGENWTYVNGKSLSMFEAVFA